MITGEVLKKSVVIAEELLRREKEFMDAINVFPVADGDTGTNLHNTFIGIRSEVEKLNGAGAGEVARAIADAALMHARGSSGLIVSQFFMGFSEGVGDVEIITPPEFRAGLELGKELAFSCVDEPEEGTILTVMEELVQVSERILHFSPELFLSGVLEHAVASLQSTADVMKRKGRPYVVDSGGYGFVLWLESVVRGAGISVNAFRYRSDVKVERVHTSLYCTNVLVHTTADAEEVRALMEKYGSSVIVVRAADKTRVHVHTPAPEEVLKILSSMGNIVHRVVDPI